MICRERSILLVGAFLTVMIGCAVSIGVQDPKFYNRFFRLNGAIGRVNALNRPGMGYLRQRKSMPLPDAVKKDSYADEYDNCFFSPIQCVMSPSKKKRTIRLKKPQLPRHRLILGIPPSN